MKQLAVDFAVRTPAAMAFKLPFWVWQLLLIGVIVFVAASWQLWSIQDQVGRLQASLAQLQQRVGSQADKPRRTAARPIAPAQAATVNAAVRQLNIPWGDLLDATEAAAGKNLALLELRPDASAHRLHGLAEARTSSDMIACIERLKAQSVFTGVVVTSHQINEQDRNKPVRFEFVATWREFQR
jgi:Tfp pilus assembly protein PilN